MKSREEMNLALFNASGHLFEAAKHLGYFSPSLAVKLMETADRIASIIDAPEEKLNKERIDDILNEILNSEK